MNISRRNFLVGAGATGVSAAVIGCHTLPTEDKMYGIGVGFGGSTGLVLDQCDVEPEVRNRIIEIVNICRTVVPQEGETVWDAWSRSASAYVGELVKSGKLTAVQGELTMAAFNLVVKGLKLLVERHEEVGTYGALAIAAIGGFCDGFLSVYKPADANGDCPDCCEGGCTIDANAVRKLRKSGEMGTLRVKVLMVKTRNLKKPAK